jgi:hypothetical protein
MSLEDHPVAPTGPVVARKKKSEIRSIMLAILVLALVLGLATNWSRNHRRAQDKHIEVGRWFGQLLEDNPTVIAEGFGGSSGGDLLRSQIHFQGRCLTPTRHSISMDVDYRIGPLGEETRLVLSSEGRSATRPIEDLIHRKVDLKAEFPEAFR